MALPATVPYILTGMRLAMANSFTTIVAAELIAANNGLGKMLWDGRLFMLVDDIFVSLVTLGMLGLCRGPHVPLEHLQVRGQVFAGDLATLTLTLSLSEGEGTRHPLPSGERVG